MSIRVLVVDDSGFFRRRVTEIINADPRMEVVGVAANGQEAIEKNDSLRPDVITMDYEMPVMDGITAIRNIMQRRPVPVLMFSSLTFEGARVTLDALDAGALDFLPKNFDAVAKDSAEIKRALTDKIAAVARNHRRSAPAPAPAVVARPAARSRIGQKDLVVIGTSTGGPAALQTLFRSIPAGFKTPIIIIQHMPGSFTKAFAERLNGLSPLLVKEAVDGDRILPSHVYVAPGGMQLMVERRNGGIIHIRESDERINYRPSVDIAFASAAKHYGNKVLGVVLTGMGADGAAGSGQVADAGGTVVVQDEQSSVVWGMPGATATAGHAHAVLPLQEIASSMERMMSEARR